ncbi:MAG: ABC transporter permease [Candidatus Hydrogenedentota bacterium]|nr:MAG: ABC transporter permease [Candidatus Hydrogenedentota bacterium]
MRFLHLILANLRRKKFRTVLTVGSFTVALFLFGLLVIIERALNQGADVAGANRLVVRNRVSIIMPLPFAYRERIMQLPGVDEVTFFVWFGGVYQDPKNFFPNFAVDAKTLRRVFPEYIIPDAEWKGFLEDRQACLVGHDLSERFEWKVGDRIPLEGAIWQGTWEFNIRGVFDVKESDISTSELWFHYDYLEEQRPFFKGTVGWYTTRVDDPGEAARVAQAIDDRFANSPYETKTETEKAFLTGFANQIGNIRLLLTSVGAVVFLTLLLVTGNTMAMSVRERTGELAVMKTVGFHDRSVLFLVIAESLAVSSVGGAFGVVLAKLLTVAGDPTGGFLPVFSIEPSEMLYGFGLAILLGAVAGLIPGLGAMRLRIVDALRKV